MNIRKSILSKLVPTIAALCGATLLSISLAAPAEATTTPPTMSIANWMYFGMYGDTQKSLAFAGGELAVLGSTVPIEYWLTSGATTYFPNESVSDLRDEVTWTLANGYLPSPTSSWQAGAARISIQHFANFVTGTSATAAYTRVTVTNPSTTTYTASLNISSPPTTELPLSGAPTTSDTSSMQYNVSITAGGSESFDFVTLAAGTATATQLQANGTFNSNFTAMSTYWNNKLATVAVPTSLPDPQLVTMYKAEQIILWEVLQQHTDGLEARGSGGWWQTTKGPSYNQYFNHDVPDIAETFIRGGDYATAKAILSSAYYQTFAQSPATNDYINAIPKYIQPFDLYAQDSGDTTLFTPTIQANIKAAAHLVQSLLVTTAGDVHDGLMPASNSMDNGSDYLLTDNWSAIYGLQAYANLAQRWSLTDPSWSSEVTWANGVAAGIDTALNNYLNTYTLPRYNTGAYDACLDHCGMDHPGYNGNTIGSTLMDSALPWDGALAGNTNLGTWSTDLDRSVLTSWTERADKTSPSYPAHDWGSWGTETTGLGSTYNAQNGVEMLESANPELRVEAIDDLEFDLSHQSAPMEWGESYSAGSWTVPLADLESWGSSGILKTILETDVSVATDGTVILGRGVPASWLLSDKSIAWSNVPVGSGQSRNFTITPSNGGTTVTVTLSSALSGTAKVELPDFVNNLASTTAGTINNTAGEVDLPAGTTTATITLSALNPAPIVVSTSTTAGATFGQSGTQVYRSQTFFASAAPSISSVQVTVRKHVGTAQTDITVGLYAAAPGGAPTGPELASGTIPAASVGTSFTTVSAALTPYSGLIDGDAYAIVLGQVTPSANTYEWAVSGSDPIYDHEHSDGTTWTKDTVGDAALTLTPSGNEITTANTAGTISAHYAFGMASSQVERAQDFLDTGVTTLHDVRVTVRDKGGVAGAQTPMTVQLYNVTDGGSYTGTALASAQVPASMIGTSDTTIDVPLSYTGMVPGQQYAIVLGQVTPSDGNAYEWSTVGTNGFFGFGQIQANGVWVREPSLGQGWLQVNGTLQ